jgi:hypothetical protein
MNSLVGEAWGIREGMSVSCSVIQNSSPLKAITISLSDEDYSMAECSLDRIQYDMLDQLSIVGRYQPAIIWLNKSIAVVASVGNCEHSFLLSFSLALTRSSIYIYIPLSSHFYF